LPEVLPCRSNIREGVEGTERQGYCNRVSELLILQWVAAKHPPSTSPRLSQNGTCLCPETGHASPLIFSSYNNYLVDSFNNPGGAATPTACNTRPAVPCSSLRNKKRLLVCSTSTYCTRSRSSITSAHSSACPRACRRACSSCRSSRAKNEQNTWPRIVSSRW